MNLGAKLQNLRKAGGMSQEQLAAQMTVSRQAVSKWELGESNPDIEYVIQLSEIFGVTVSPALIGGFLSISLLSTLLFHRMLAPYPLDIRSWALFIACYAVFAVLSYILLKRKYKKSDKASHQTKAWFSKMKTKLLFEVYFYDAGSAKQAFISGKSVPVPSDCPTDGPAQPVCRTSHIRP